MPGPGRGVRALRARGGRAARSRCRPGRELALAYANLAVDLSAAAGAEEAIAWAERALELAERLGETEIARLRALDDRRVRRGSRCWRQSLERASRRAGAERRAGRAYSLARLASAVEIARSRRARRLHRGGLAYCSERGLELFRLYLLAYRAPARARPGPLGGRGRTAARPAHPAPSTTPRIIALVVLGARPRAPRRPGEWALLDEAWALAEPTGELPRRARRGGPGRGSVARRRPRRSRRSDGERPRARLERCRRGGPASSRAGAGVPASTRSVCRARRSRTRSSSRATGAGAAALWADARLPVRGGARPCGRGRRGGAAPRARRAAALGAQAGGGDRRPPAARARRPRPPARAAAGDASRTRRPDGA